MSSLLRGSVIFTFIFGGAAGKLGTMFGLGMPYGHNVTAAHDVSAQGLGGSVMQRVYTKYAGLPVGAQALSDAGWTKHNTECDQKLGYVWTQNRRGPTKAQPLLVYTTKDGLPAGVGTVFRETMPDNQLKWTTANPLVAYAGSGTTFQVDIAFRESDVCTENAGHSGIGDVLIVNPAGVNKMEIPLTHQQPWVKGSCFDGMGQHSFLNTNPAGPGPMPWAAGDLFPVVVMYHEGQISAIFFASVNDQLTAPFWAANWWEPVSLSNDAMCANWCDNNCGFNGNGKGEWSTMHIYFNDYAQVKCPAEMRCASEGNWAVPGRRSCCASEPGTHNAPDPYMENLQQLLAVLGILLVGAIVLGFAFRARSRQAEGAREVQVSEMASAGASAAA